MLQIRPVRMNYIGLPRSGKTSFRHCLLGEFLNLLMAMAKGKYELPSTGVAEAGGQVLIRSVCSDLQSRAEKVWSMLKSFGDEANLLSQFVSQAVYDDELLADSSVGGTTASPTPPDPAHSGPLSLKFSDWVLSLLKKFVGMDSSKPDPSAPSEEEPECDIEESFSVISAAMAVGD